MSDIKQIFIVLFYYMLLVSQDQVYTAFDSQLGAVKRQMIAPGISPFFAGIVIVIAGRAVYRSSE